MIEREYTEKEYYTKFQVHSCPRCLSHKVIVNVRTKTDMAYKVYICAKCKGIIRRERAW